MGRWTKEKSEAVKSVAAVEKPKETAEQVLENEPEIEIITEKETPKKGRMDADKPSEFDAIFICEEKHRTPGYSEKEGMKCRICDKPAPLTEIYNGRRWIKQ